MHAPGYVAEVRDAAARGAPFLHSPDTPLCRASFAAARVAAGGVLRAIDAVIEGRARNAFCAVRPPGHHAAHSRAAGFCLFNNAAIGARYLQRRHGLRRILILDWDLHHGNGTQAVFEDDPDVFYCSVHQVPLYPGSGCADERGTGRGAGATLNVPLPAGSGDADYAHAFETALVPAARAFRPEFVLVSAGFDAHAADPLGGMQLTAAGFADLTRRACRLAGAACAGRLVSVLEGGYALGALADSAAAHLAALAE